MYFDCRCAYCGITWDEHFSNTGKDLHKEHVIMDGKDDLSNCVPSCKVCNSEKWEHSFNNWYNVSNSKYNRIRHLRIYQWLRYDYKKFIEPKLKPIDISFKNKLK